MKITDKMIEVAAKAMEREYHKGGGTCGPQDGGPNNCWKSMVDFARAGLLAAIQAEKKRTYD